MTAPLVVLGVGSAVGGWLNLPDFLALGPIGVLDKWLDPVVGASALRITGGLAPEIAHGTELVLVGLAVAIAAAGIWIAVATLHPAALVPKAQARPERGIERVLAHAYFVDDIYDETVVRGTVDVSRNLLWRWIDIGLIDAVMVNGSAWAARFAGFIGSQLQSGRLGTYAWILVIGVLLVLGAVRRSVAP